MQLVEQHCIGKNDARYPLIDAAAFASKNLYNLATYHVRQSFIHSGVYLGYAQVYHMVKASEASAMLSYYMHSTSFTVVGHVMSSLR